MAGSDIILCMDFTFSFGWMAGGIAIIAAGTAVVIFYKQIAEGLANGVSSYETVKKVGLIAVVVGMLVASNLHTFVLTLLVNFITGR